MTDLQSKICDCLRLADGPLSVRQICSALNRGEWAVETNLVVLISAGRVASRNGEYRLAPEVAQ